MLDTHISRESQASRMNIVPGRQKFSPSKNWLKSVATSSMEYNIIAPQIAARHHAKNTAKDVLSTTLLFGHGIIGLCHRLLPTQQRRANVDKARLHV